MMIKMMINKINIAIGFLLLSNLLFSQGLIETVPTTNQVLVNKWNANTQKSVYIKPSIHDTLQLDYLKGFLDDFSNAGPFPDTAKWLDNFVFINRDYPIAPPTLGVATFDGVNQYGYPYNFLASQYSTGKADTLTSKCINLKTIVYNSSGRDTTITPSDSLYFSFYYQPQGLGNAPEGQDSLILEFKYTEHDSIVRHTVPQVRDSIERFTKTVWRNVWSHGGYPLGANDSSWRIVMIPITDTSFLKKDFQFRFTNYATLSGNGDQWNIDYVYLNRNRHLTDTVFREIAFVYDPISILKSYTAMPYKHYDPSFMKDSINIPFRNNDTVNAQALFTNKIYKPFPNPIFPPTSQTENAYLFSLVGYNFHTFKPQIIPAIPSLTDSATYIFESVLFNTSDNNHRNDTVRHEQKFLNYYAYDDGTAESAFGLGGTNITNGELAVQFTSTIPDSLHYIDIYFNPLWINSSQFSFNLMVWNDAGGVPGTAIYTGDTVAYPVYHPTFFGPDHFTRFKLDNPLYLPASTFYIGFLQNTNQFLNVGVDKRTNSADKIFYNVTGSWYNSPYYGSLMMRPVFSPNISFEGIKESSASNSFTVYPNPANERLFIKSTSVNQYEKINYTVMDVYGRIIAESKLTNGESIDISNLSEGIYFIHIVDGTSISTNKFIKIK